MNIVNIFSQFKTQEQSIEYLEKKRWPHGAVCMYCGSPKVCRHSSPDRKQPRWQCQDCHSTFSVTVGTIFHGTHIPLRDWFLVLALMVNAKKSLSSCQVARDLGIRRPTIWSMMHRIRNAMVNDPGQKELFYGIVEADETYIGGKPRGKDQENKRGRGTKKTPVIGVVERKGRVAAEPVINDRLNSNKLMAFIHSKVDALGSMLCTDEYRGYSPASKSISHAVIDHQKGYVNGFVHTNTIEGFWSLLKRAWYGQHHHYSKKYMNLYVAEACFKYNNRQDDSGFDILMDAMVCA